MSAIRPGTIAAVAAVAAMFSPVAAAFTVRYVDDDAGAGGDGRSWGTAYAHLQDAIYEAGGDPSITEIRVAGGSDDRSLMGQKAAIR